MHEFVYRYTCKGCGAIREVITLRELTPDQKRHLRKESADYLKKVISERIENLRVYKHKIERDLNCDNEYRADNPIASFDRQLDYSQTLGSLMSLGKVLQDIHNWKEKGDEK